MNWSKYILYIHMYEKYIIYINIYLYIYEVNTRVSNAFTDECLNYIFILKILVYLLFYRRIIHNKMGHNSLISDK